MMTALFQFAVVALCQLYVIAYTFCVLHLLQNLEQEC